MAGKLDHAYQRSKLAIESMYRDKATIYTKKSVASTSGFDDAVDWVQIAEDIPAKISKSGLSPAEKGIAPSVDYDAMLFTGLDVEVPPEAKIVVTDVNGNQTAYRRASGSYTAYRTHQEVALNYEERK